ncbi:IspD/TarI family cytidylyltransferase [Kineosporia babensis]|uniref:2-C-methyl-D-erythritol 4-phosphate cytidylyltransferase n=1 Tax=Kineosporia babensis TaxID=499548 RepID=A0A9X1N9H4_9ACTN|nr:2-C-methyl-D-erythritol 4-phosphate cytidylyltransferase [Kineosporia babensis]MCD5309676.1 2-C-methyl-D-erythritol 4-phosphate cytidylyltransferase [Kineosporia babensis]
MSVWGVVLAGGGGTRFGGLKQFAKLGEQTLLERVVSIAAECCDGVVVVLPAGHDWKFAGNTRNATGGATRAESVRSGLRALPEDAEVVCITDAAHPLATPELYERVIAAVRAGADAALPGLPLTDAVKKLEDDGLAAGATVTARAPQVNSETQAESVRSGDTSSSPRILGLAGATTAAGGSVSAQMPMAFDLAVLRRAHEQIEDAVEDSAMVGAAGGRVVVVAGEPTNVHVTTPDELRVAQALLPLV